MNLFRNITHSHSQPSSLETLTPRLLEDAGLRRREVRSIIGALLAALTPRFTIESIQQR
jgi:uncharacterized protein YjiS (DUF1127 family)